MWLIGKAGDSAVFLFKLTDGSQTIGRSTGCEIAVADENLSRKHAKVTRLTADNSTILEDLSSKNGVRVNGVRVQRCNLKLEDRIELGSLEFQVVDEQWLLNRLRGIEDETLSQGKHRESHSNAPRSEALTPAQEQVLVLLLEGLDEKTAAKRLNRSTHTIHNHVRKIYEVFEVHSRSELLALVLGR
jgi:pSer/pThr/pTyr-binding forkhead associated (FHA) protein